MDYAKIYLGSWFSIGKPQNSKMKTINREIAAILFVGVLLTISGLYLDFQNLARAQDRYINAEELNNNEMVAVLIEFVGMLIIFFGVTRGLLRRSDLMANKFVNIMDVFTTLVKKQLEVIGDHEKADHLKEIDEKSRKFKSELSDLKRI